MFTHTGHVMTLANSIIGVGILAMPFCFQKCGIILAILLLILSNWITRICCHYLIKCSLLTRRKSFEFLGLHAFGASGKMLAELCIIGYLVGNCITYFVVVGDLGPQIVVKLFALDTQHPHLRTVVMFAVTILCIVPLGMLRNVDSLSTLCTASIGFYVCLVLKIVLESELHIVANDWTTKVIYWEPAGILQCLPIFSMALSCQMQIFEVFASINNQSLEKLNGIVRNATWICTCVYIAVGFFGYVAFFTQPFGGNILMNLSTSFSSDIIKCGFVLSVAFSFPLVIFPCRASIYSLLYRKGNIDSSSYIPEPRFKVITLFIISFSLCVALMIPSVELIIGLVGSTIGVAICIMFPASSFRKIIKKESTERTLAQFILVSGFCLMILGTYANLNAIDEKSSGAHLQVALDTVDESLIPPPTPLINIEKTLETDESLKKANFIKTLKLVDVKKEPMKEIVEEGKLKPIQNFNNIIAKSEQKLPEPPLPIDEKHIDSIGKLDSRNEENLINKKVDNLNIENNKMKPEIEPKKLPQPPPSTSTKPESNDAKPMPPLPEEELPIVVKPLSIIKDPEALDGNKSMTNESIKTKLENLAPTREIIPLGLNRTVQENIDRAAIKKEEDVVAEEQKENKEHDNSELRKTQNELKKTKELLERTVDELKEELAKQNKETQHLVVEKLSEVVEKVEQIERKVQKDASIEQVQQAVRSKPEPSAILEVNPNMPEKQSDVNSNKDNPKGSLLNMLTDSVHAREEQEAHAGVFEPQSYKTGEKMSNNNKLKLDLPLPLALLRNATQENPPTEISSNKMNEKKIPQKSSDTNETMKNENVEAIRRDLLQLKSTYVSMPPPSGDEPLQSRIRRDVNDLRLETHQNCLTEPKLDKLSGSTAELSFQIENIGRDLKSLSIEQEEDQHNQPET